MKNAMTIDVEEWYHGHDFNIAPELWDSFENRVVYSTNILLELLFRHNIRGTFFVLGCVAKKHPKLIEEIAKAGHEIGSHGYWHRMVNLQTRNEFRSELLSSKHILEDITGKEIKLFRAPSWSLTADTLWLLEILEEESFVCDSSIQPFKSPFYGLKGAPVVPFHPIINGHKLKLVEFPPPVLQIGKNRLPFAGGLYLRVWPQWFIAWALAKVNRENPGMVYVHPWEIDTDQPRFNASLLARLAHYYNLKTTINKLDVLLQKISPMPLGELIENEEYPFYPITQAKDCRKGETS